MKSNSPSCYLLWTSSGETMFSSSERQLFTILKGAIFTFCFPPEILSQKQSILSIAISLDSTSQIYQLPSYTYISVYICICLYIHIYTHTIRSHTYFNSRKEHILAISVPVELVSFFLCCQDHYNEIAPLVISYSKDSRSSDNSRHYDILLLHC